MSDSTANDTMTLAAEHLARARSLLITTHARPDGDGLGSMVALARCAEAAGKKVHLVTDDIPERYAFLFAGRETAGLSRFPRLAENVDLVVILDTSTPMQMDSVAECLPAVHDKTIVIDHHAVGGDLGIVQWIDPDAAATGVLVGELLDHMGWDVGRDAAEALMASLVSDTGWLRYANTDARSLIMAAEWVGKGVRTDELYHRLYQNARPTRLKLLARVLDSLELHSQDRLAVMTLTGEDFAATGARPEETENLINASLEIGTVETAIILIENEDNIRVSLRSRELLDVAAIARQFGGGGHRRAAGVRIADRLDVVKDKLIHICDQALRKAVK